MTVVLNLVVSEPEGHSLGAASGAGRRPEQGVDEAASNEAADRSGASSSGLRLTIEPSDNGGVLYRLTDPLTGKVVRELPRQTLAEQATTGRSVSGSAVSIGV